MNVILSGGASRREDPKSDETVDAANGSHHAARSASVPNRSVASAG
jgi:hypothetical protein